MFVSYYESATCHIFAFVFTHASVNHLPATTHLLLASGPQAVSNRNCPGNDASLVVV